MKIKILESYFNHGTETYRQGDQREVDDALGRYFCEAGWAQDLSGKVETKARQTTQRVVLSPDNLESQVGVK